MNVIKRILRRPLGVVRSVISARNEAKGLRQQLTRTRRRLTRTRQQLKRTRQQLTQTKQQLTQSRRYLKQAARHYDRLESQNTQLGIQFMQMGRDYLLCMLPKGSVCAEIGVHEGEFSRRIFDTVEPKRLHLIDPWKKGEGLFGQQAAREQATLDRRYAKVEQMFAEELAASRVQIHRNLSSEIHDDFEDSYFDWIYIDGNHAYEYVKQDLELYYPKVKAGGYMAGDDYGIVGFWDNGVQRAVDEFVSRKPELTLQVKASQFIIQKGSSE